MAKVSIATVNTAQVSSSVGTGKIDTRSLFSGPDDPIHLSVHEIGAHAKMAFRGESTDVALFVWKGSIEGGGAELAEKSSAVVEHEATLEVAAGAYGATVLEFSLSAKSELARTGGHVHLLPRDRERGN